MRNNYFVIYSGESISFKMKMKREYSQNFYKEILGADVYNIPDERISFLTKGMEARLIGQDEKDMELVKKDIEENTGAKLILKQN